MGDVQGQELDFRPFGDEVGESLKLDGGARDILDVVIHELECPLRDPSHGVVVADDVPKWVRSDNRDFVVGEIVQKFLCCH